MTNLETLKAQIARLETVIAEWQDSIQSKQSEIDNFEYECSESEFDEFLDDCHETYSLGSMTFYPSDVLKSCDPIAYRICKSEYESDYDLDDCEEYQELWTELQGLKIDLESLEGELDDLETEIELLESE